MITKYVLEIWNETTRQYIPCWQGSDIDWANKMYDKPYHRIHTRRLVQVNREVLFQDKGKNKWFRGKEGKK